MLRLNQIAFTVRGRQLSGKGRRAFTLIELLIVVGILAVLAAIATPNFLEASARSKVSRTHNDLRALATAIETYRTDNNTYPLVGNPAAPHSNDLFIRYDTRLASLSTPIAYLSSSPKDPFYSSAATGTEGLSPDYAYCPGNIYVGGTLTTESPYRSTIYSVSGRGPDKKINAGGYCMAHPRAFENKINITGLYDPTNGTVSEGDVFRLGSGSMGTKFY